MSSEELILDKSNVVDPFVTLLSETLGIEKSHIKNELKTFIHWLIVDKNDCHK